MAVEQGVISSIITFQGKRLFTVAQEGTFVEVDDKVATGTIDSGLISYGIPEEKIAIYLDVRYLSLDGTDAVYLARRDGVFTLLGTNTELVTVPQFDAGSTRSEFFEIRHMFTRDTTDHTLGPVLTRHTLKSQVTANMGSYWIVPVLLADREEVDGNEIPRDVLEEFMFLAGLATDKATFTFQYLSTPYTVIAEDTEFKPSHLNSTSPVPTGYNGTMFMKLKVVV
jgi:hypothetical protein